MEKLLARVDQLSEQMSNNSWLGRSIQQAQGAHQLGVGHEALALLQRIRRRGARLGGQAQPHQRRLRRVDRRATSLGLSRRHIRRQRGHQTLAAQRDAKVSERELRVFDAHAQSEQIAARARHSQHSGHTKNVGETRRPACQDSESSRRVLGTRACLVSALLLCGRRRFAGDHRQHEKHTALAKTLQEDVRWRALDFVERRQHVGSRRFEQRRRRSERSFYL